MSGALSLIQGARNNAGGSVPSSIVIYGWCMVLELQWIRYTIIVYSYKYVYVGWFPNVCNYICAPRYTLHSAGYLTS